MAKITAQGLDLLLSGKVGSTVISRTKHGTIVRPCTQPKNPRTPAQIAARARMTQVSRTWGTLTNAQILAWNTYAIAQNQTERANEQSGSVAPHTLFIALGCKFLQVNPGASLPLTPPPSPFFGDGIVVTATGGSGHITFTATGPNAANIVTELLFQPVRNAHRAPKSNLYRPHAFWPFVPGTLSLNVTTAPGWYAPAYRFVNAATGQQGPLVPLPNVQVV
jgi:hypothetical protein